MTMTVNVLPELAAGIFGIILSLSLRLKYTDAEEANVHFRHLVYAVTFATVTDVVFTMAQWMGSRVPQLWFLINLTAFYAATAASGFTLLHYVTIRTKRHESRFFLFQKILLCVNLFLLCINLFTRTFFDCAPDGTILYGRFHLPVVYGATFWFILSSSVVQGVDTTITTRLQRIVQRFVGELLGGPHLPLLLLVGLVMPAVFLFQQEALELLRGQGL